MSVILGGAVFAMALGSGWLLARALTAGAWQGQRWASVLVELSIGSLFGPGLASVLYFALVAAGVASRGSVLGMLVALLAASVGLWWKLTPVIPISEAPAANPGKRFPYLWVLWIAVVVGLVFFFLDFQAASSANPAGEWDAMAIWNLRARYLASGGDFWRRAVSPEMGGHMTGAVSDQSGCRERVAPNTLKSPSLGILIYLHCGCRIAIKKLAEHFTRLREGRDDRAD